MGDSWQIVSVACLPPGEISDCPPGWEPFTVHGGLVYFRRRTDCSVSASKPEVAPPKARRVKPPLPALEDA